MEGSVPPAARLLRDVLGQCLQLWSATVAGSGGGNGGGLRRREGVAAGAFSPGVGAHHTGGEPM